MRLTDPFKRFFLSEESRRMEMDSVGSGSTEDPDGEHEARKLESQIRILEEIRDKGYYWP